MTTTAEATAAPVELKLNGKTWYVSPLAEEDYGEFERWVQDKYVELVKRNLGDLSDDESSKQLSDAFRHAATITMHSAQSLRLMSTVDGCVKLLWLGMRRRQPDLTEQDVYGIISNPRLINQALDAIDRANKFTGTRALKKRPVIRKKRPKPLPRTGRRR